jgi:hypothetical protein
LNGSLGHSGSSGSSGSSSTTISFWSSGHRYISQQRSSFSTSIPTGVSRGSAVDGDGGEADGSPGQPVKVRSKRTGKLVPVPAGLAGDLAPLAEQCGSNDASEVAKSAATLHGTRQRGMVEHGQAVASYLQQELGIKQPQLGRLLLRCPTLFSWPTAERAQQLFEQLMSTGVFATEAAKCFERRPAIANSRSFQKKRLICLPNCWQRVAAPSSKVYQDNSRWG